MQAAPLVNGAEGAYMLHEHSRVVPRRPLWVHNRHLLPASCRTTADPSSQILCCANRCATDA